MGQKSLKINFELIDRAIFEAGFRSANDFCKKTGISQEHLSRSRKKGELGYVVLANIAKGTGKPLSYFTGGKKVITTMDQHVPGLPRESELPPFTGPTDGVEVTPEMRDDYQPGIAEPGPVYGNPLFSELRAEEERIKQRDLPNFFVSLSQAFENDLMVPVKEMDLPVGAGVTMNDDTQYRVRHYPSRQARGATHVLTVRGKSMNPEIEDGDKLWVEVIDYQPAEGKTIIANLIGDGIRVSHVFYREDGKIGLGRKRGQAEWFAEDEIRIVAVVLKIEKTETAIERMNREALED